MILDDTEHIMQNRVEKCLNVRKAYCRDFVRSVRTLKSGLIVKPTLVIVITSFGGDRVNKCQ